MSRSILTLALVTAGCASAGGGADPRVRTAETSLSVVEAEECLSRELRRVGFRVLEGDEDDGVVRSVRPRSEILGIPTSDDFDRIDARVTAAANGVPAEIRLTLGTFDGNEEEDPSAEVRRDAEAVLQACR